MDNYYKNLGVSTKASPEDLKKRYEKKLKGYLLFGLNNRKIKKIESLKTAFEHLIDPALRNKHDLELGLYAPNSQAPWRQCYQNYSGQSLKDDLNFSTELLADLHTRFEGQKVVPGIIFMLFGLLLGLIILLYGILRDPENVGGALRASSPSLVANIFHREEQELFELLESSQKKELLGIIRQIEQIKTASNFPEMLNSCKIHLEAVSLAEELIIKYQGLLSCLHTAAKI